VDTISPQHEQLSLGLDLGHQLSWQSFESWSKCLLDQAGINGPPVPVRLLTAFAGVKRIVRVKMDLDAFLVRASDGYVIGINAAHLRERQRFSIAHELAHLFLIEQRQQRAQRIVGRCASAPIGFETVTTEKEHIERFCQEAAAELLMPGAWFTREARQRPPSIGSVVFLARHFRVSVPAVVVRLEELAPWRCILMVSKYTDRPGSDERKLRISCFARHEDMRYYVPRHKPIPEQSSIWQAFRVGHKTQATERLELGGLRGNFMVESAAFGRSKNRYVLTIVRETSTLSAPHLTHSSTDDLTLGAVAT